MPLEGWAKATRDAARAAGSNWPSNLQGLCKSCNSAKSTRDFAEFIGSGVSS